jgi:hypothetical protein
MSNIEKLARYIGEKQNPERITAVFLASMKAGQSQTSGSIADVIESSHLVMSEAM